jgi:septal ring factor EnvC (AmiA/AmiB activator)
MKPTATQVLIAVNTAAIILLAFMLFKGNQTNTHALEAIEAQLEKNNQIITDNQQAIQHQLQTIAERNDTIKIIKQHLKTNEKIYYRDLGYILDMDSSERAVEYSKTFRKAYGQFKSGHPVYFPGQPAK